MIIFTPLLLAAMVFSFTPPIGRICPVRVTSPVIAKSFLTDFPMAKDNIDVTIVHPALGPSFGVAPAGTCKCSFDFAKKGLFGSFSSSTALQTVCAIVHSLS
uniref:Secreted protein n=1 Tax=Arundo donax TaxID=35708 RepID=A0A0A9CGC6_ARUDO